MLDIYYCLLAVSCTRLSTHRLFAKLISLFMLVLLLQSFHTHVAQQPHIDASKAQNTSDIWVLSQLCSSKSLPKVSHDVQLPFRFVKALKSRVSESIDLHFLCVIYIVLSNFYYCYLLVLLSKNKRKTDDIANNGKRSKLLKMR